MNPIAGAPVWFLQVYKNGNLKTKTKKEEEEKKILHSDFVNTMQPPGDQKISMWF